MKRPFKASNVLLSLFLFASGCGVAPDLIEVCAQNETCASQTKESDDSTAIDDRIDEERPPFAEIPGSGSDAVVEIPDSGEPTTPTIPTTPGSGGYGVNENMSCSDYVAQFWKVGGQTYEEAPGPLFTKLKYTTKVISISGAQVTIHAKLETPDSSQNVDEQVTFDACKNGHMSAVPKTNSPCTVQFLANETVTVGGKTYNAKKYKLGECNLESGKTFGSVVWRAAELPLWGIVKREVTGTVVPDSLSGKISATIKSWLFN